MKAPLILCSTELIKLPGGKPNPLLTDSEILCWTVLNDNEKKAAID